jgi:hypothetical protein
LADQFGIDRLLQAQVVFFGKDFFPEPYRATEGHARLLLEWLCAHARVPPGRVRLQVCPEAQLQGNTWRYERLPGPGPDAGGHLPTAQERPETYTTGKEGVSPDRPEPPSASETGAHQEVARIWVADSHLVYPEALLATLTRGLTHDLLADRRQLVAEDSELEWLSDLLAVFLGLGAFAANTAVIERQDNYGLAWWWSLNKHSELPPRIFGYAFALCCFLRGEDRPAWASRLRLDVAAPLKEGLRFLNKTGDSLFHPDTVRAPRQPPSAAEAVARLREGPPSARLAALWEVRQQRWEAAEVLAAVLSCLADPDPDLRSDAAGALEHFGPAAAPAIPRLLRNLRDEASWVRTSAAWALELRLQANEVIPELCLLLYEQRSPLLGPAAWGLSGLARRPARPTSLWWRRWRQH